MQYLIVGLGNIGEEYTYTRHNFGFRFIDFLNATYKGSFQIERYASFSAIKIRGKQIAIIKPSTFVNESGKAVRYWVNFYKVPLQNLLVVLDDIALPFGKTRLRDKGSDGGHNGLTSIQSALQTTGFPRLRIGIGNNYPKGHQVEYVLCKFSAGEEKELPVIFEIGHQQVLSFINKGIGI